MINESLFIDDPATNSKDEEGMMARYFHPGCGSAGCFTIKSRSEWTDVVKFVSRCRLDDEHVGYVDILPEK